MADKKVTVIIAGENQAGAVLEQVKKQLGETKHEAEGLGELFEFGMILEGVNKLREMTEQTVETNAQFAIMAQKTGISTETLSELGYAAEQTGVSQEALDQGLKLLTRSMNDTSIGTGKSKEAFAALGVSVTDSNGKLRPTKDVLMDLADRFSKMPDGPQKSAMAMQIFGKSGADMIPILDQGRDGIEALTDRAHQLGATISHETAESMHQFHRDMSDANVVSESMERQFVSGLTPALDSIIKEFTDGTHGLDWFKIAGEGVGYVLRFLVAQFDLTSAVFGAMAQSLVSGAMIVKDAFVIVSDEIHGSFRKAVADSQALSDDWHAYLATMKADAQKFGTDIEKLFTDSASPVSEKKGDSGDDRAEKAAAKIKELIAAEKELDSIIKTIRDEHADAITKITEHYDELLNKVRDVMAKEPALHFQAAQEIVAIEKAKGEALRTEQEKERDAMLALWRQGQDKLLQQALDFHPNIKGPMDQLKEYEKEIQQLTELLRVQDQQIQLDQQQGLDSKDAQAARDRTLHQLQDLVSAYSDLANKTGDQGAMTNALKMLVELGNEVTREQSKFQSFAKTVQQDLGQGIGGAFKDLITGSKSVSQAFSDMGKSIINDIAGIIANMLEMYAVQQMVGMFGSLFGGGLSIGSFGSVAGLSTDGAGALGPAGFLGSGPMFPSLPGLATGGDVSAGQAYMVGEQGPELFVPSGAGSIVPNGDFGGGGGTTVVYNIDARGADASVEQRIMGVMKQMQQQTVALAVKTVNEQGMRR